MAALCFVPRSDGLLSSPSLPSLRLRTLTVSSWARNEASAEWNDDDDLAGLSGGWRETRLSPTFCDDFDNKLSQMVSAFAINTCAYYFVEFRDEVNEKWMSGFLNYKQDGFPGGKWTTYIEAMIAMDKLQVEVFMQCSKAVLRARRIPAGANVAMQYHHDIEPRRIAHKILTVREDLCNEIIEVCCC